MSILLTRPEGENESLAERLGKRFSDIRICPLIELLPVKETQAIRKAAQDLDQVDVIVFVSKSAVRFTIPLLDSYWPQWPVTLTWVAVGEGTANELAAWDLQAEYPDQPGSEGVLELSAMADIRGRKVMIVRGLGGRTLMGDELLRRGADVTYLETYQRVPRQVASLSELPRNTIVVVTSVELLEAASDSIGQRLSECRLITASQRIADAAVQMGARQVFDAGGASDQALYDAIVELV